MTPPLPAPVLRDTLNETPFQQFVCQKMGKGRVFYDCIVFKGTFDLRPGIVPLSDEQAPVELADSYHDPVDATRSSVARPGDLHLAKAGTDVIVTGNAQPPGCRPTTRWRTEVLVHDGSQPILDHSLDATGPRRWERRALRGWTLSEPEATIETPIRYELAYGGHYPDPASAEGTRSEIVYRPNPSGSGFFLERAMNDAEAYPGPQWESPGAPVTSINRDSPLAGFGPVARMWESRLAFGGTYDAAWEEAFHRDAAAGRFPDYPADLDPRFFQCAHPALQSQTPLRGDEQLMLRGLVAESPELAFRLPAVRPVLRLFDRVAGWRDAPAPPLDTLHIDLEARRVHVVWRVMLDPRRGVIAAAAHTEGGSTC